MGSVICYHACLVSDGIIIYIAPVSSRKGAIAVTKYWKKFSPQYNESFAFKIIPKKWKKQIEEYWEKDEEYHKAEIDTNNNELPWF